MAATQREKARKLIAENRQARRNYEIEDTYEAGIVLKGTEVKSLRAGRANIAESYAREEDGEIILINSSIPIYPPAAQFNHEPGRKRKLLLKKKEMAKLIPHAQLKVFDDASHFALWQDPQAFNKVLVEFLAP